MGGESETASDGGAVIRSAIILIKYNDWNKFLCSIINPNYEDSNNKK